MRAMRENPSLKPANCQGVDLLDPLAHYYEAIGAPLPRPRPVSPEQMPQPCRRLLVHTNDMTPTLEAFVGQPLALRPLRKQLNGHTLERTVVLVGTRDGRPIEFGAIRIHLDTFDERARKVIRASRVPLGAILRDQRIEHTCHPGAYFRVESDPVMNEALRLKGAHALHGRHNTMQHSGRSMAEVVEILPPLDEPK